MTPVILSVKAESDLAKIADDIGERSPKRAASYVREILEHAGQLAHFPHSGTPMPHLADNVRRLVHGRYLIFYSVHDDRVQIERVVHGARDLDRLFEDEPLPE